MLLPRLAIAVSLFFVGGCTTIAGYRSPVVPEVTVIPMETVGRLRREPSTIKMVRSRQQGLMAIVNTLLDRAGHRGARYVTLLQTSWFEASGDSVYRCGARIQPVVMVGVDGAKAWETEEIEGASPEDLPPQTLARVTWSGVQGFPSTDTLSRTRPFDPDPDLRIRRPGYRQWGLKMDAPSCVHAPGPANDRIILDATVY